jgi:hypothetical protein
MKTLLFIGFLLLIVYQLTTLEGYPSNASFTVPSNGVIPDSVMDQIKIGHSSLMYIRNGSEINMRLDNLFNAGLTPGLVIYIPPSIEIGTPKYNDILTKLRKAMKLPDTIVMSERMVYVYVPQTGVYTKYYGRCNDMKFKINPEGTNCA